MISLFFGKFGQFLTLGHRVAICGRCISLMASLFKIWISNISKIIEFRLENSEEQRRHVKKSKCKKKKKEKNENRFFEITTSKRI